MLVLLPTLVVVPLLWSNGPIAQDPAYHDFADQRVFLGVPHAGDVLSNIAFVLVALIGLSLSQPIDYTVFFFGLLLTGIGSGHYHLAPDDAGLALDRAPMTAAFMGLTAAVIREHVSATWGRWLLWPLVIFGLWSVEHWMRTGDLRPYVVTQYVSLLTVFMALLFFPGPARMLWLAGVGYGLAKLCEHHDWEIWEATGHVVSGHNLKHGFAALGTLAVVWMLARRNPPEGEPTPAGAQ